MARRTVNVFSLSFLDVMACGLGSVVLLFMIINHAAEVRSDEKNKELLAEVNLLEHEVLKGKKNLVELKNSLEYTDKELVTAQGLSRHVITDIKHSELELAELDKETTARKQHLAALKADLKAAEEGMKRLEGSRADQEDQGAATRSFIGQGDRQYLTGLKVGGKRILILVDKSASMMDETIVNIIRRRNMPDAEKIKARKWQRMIATVDWLTTQIPLTSKFQIYTFNVQAAPVIEGTRGTWLEVAEDKQLNQAIQNLRLVIPRDGTSLYNAFAIINKLNPKPDNIYLLTDGLPTQSKTPERGPTVSGKTRLRHFEQALKQLSAGIPVNTILFPLEGDPMAASAYWQLAMITRGSFLSPSRDWP
jgi:hypothetical protein